MDELAAELDLLTDILGSLAVDDATKRTTILESISALFARLNAAKAKARARSNELGSGEARAEFAAQFTLFSQSITNALAQASTPERCDEQLARLTINLDELEGRFGEYDEFLADIVIKREEMQDAFDAHRQTLLDQRQRRSQNLFAAAERMLEGISKRAQQLSDVDALNTYFTTDPMVLKLKDTAATLRELDDAVKAEELEGRLKSAADTSLRGLRDRRDIFENDGAVIRLGKHRFAVNAQPLELTVIPREDGLYAHLTGTGFAEQIHDEILNRYRDQWQQALPSETDQVYRAEYLAAEVLREARTGRSLTLEALQQALLDEAQALKLIRDRATERYAEGYEKGVHDHDTYLILKALMPRLEEIGLLSFSPDARALGALFWYCQGTSEQARIWHAQAVTAAHLDRHFPGNAATAELVDALALAIDTFAAQENLSADRGTRAIAEYLAQELASPTPQFTVSQSAQDLLRAFRDQLRARSLEQDLNHATKLLEDQVGLKFRTLCAWMQAIAGSSAAGKERAVAEAALMALVNDESRFHIKAASVELEIRGLLGQHPRVSDQSMTLAVDDFLERLDHHRNDVVPAFQALQQQRHRVAEALREEMQLEDFVARPLSSFVRNRLLNDVYLPIIGDNLAKQLGAADDARRTDLMGLLLLISPPGYGKTTLMEYVANRLGLTFVKVNGPALGHDVRSLDPAQAPNATAVQELEKLNLAFEMGNNVMLYVDDIQHTHPEFLQKFISLCDGTRRIEGVWRQDSKTYDLRGRRFCVVMAGNPYTESGDMFQVPDMLANRADVYNLGDVLSGREEAFALSYLENSLTSNAILAPLATRDMEDVYRFIRRAQGQTVADSEFVHPYSSAESNEVVAVLERMLKVQGVLLAVNKEYIRSAATADAYRTEPPFKLQGSYRNMNKLAEKVLPIMNDAELQALLDDHYAGEAQLLTGEAEFNLLRLAELRGQLDEVSAERLEAIRKEFRRTKAIGGEDADAGTKLAHQLSLIGETLSGMQAELSETDDISRSLASLSAAIGDAEIKIINQPSEVVEKAMADLARTIETTFMPVVAAMDKKIDLDLAILRRVSELNSNVEAYQQDKEPDA